MSYRTDLAAESECLRDANLPAGVTQTQRTLGNLTIHTVRIAGQPGAQVIGKPPGEYVTVTTPPLQQFADFSEEEVAEMAGELAAMLPQEGVVLVVGLGNNDITPDAIGPRTIHQVLATRHISDEMIARVGLESLRPVATIAPGVLGQTGIETSEIVRSVVERIEPAAVVVVDALASRSADRLGCTIQIASSGISPGSGVMNARRELSCKTLGVPVISVGVPTVVDASTLAGDLLNSSENDLEKRRAMFEPRGQAMMITPREIDQLIGHACRILSFVINKALQPQLTLEEIGYLAG